MKVTTTKAQRAQRFIRAKMEWAERIFFTKRTHSGSWCSLCLCGSTPKFTERSHALGAPVQSSRFQVQRCRKLRNEAMRGGAIFPSAKSVKSAVKKITK